MILKRSLLILLVSLLIACSPNRLDVDVSAVKIDEVKIDRLEQDLFSSKPVNKDLTEQLQKKYGNFYFGFLNVINGHDVPDSAALTSLQQFTRDSAMKGAFKDCQAVFPNLNDVQTDLTGVFKHFRYYFPNRPLPRVFSCMSGFNINFTWVDSTVGIALEMYLGKNNKFYQMIQFPKYKTATMSKEYLASDFTRAWMTTYFPKVENRKDFLAEIIYNGKLLYLTDALLPDVSDTIKIGYSKKHLDWCKRNEYNMWAYFVQKKVLYVSDPTEIVKYTGEGPFTAAFNKESPSRVGIWIGWQIVRSFMNNNPKVSLEDLVNEKDAQIILARSKYKPSK